MQRFCRYHDDVPFGKVFECPDAHEKDYQVELRKEGWVDSPAKLKENWHHTGCSNPEVIEKAKKLRGPYGMHNKSRNKKK